MIISTRFIPRGFAAMTVWPLILVRPECRDDAALTEHELVHYREQRWITQLSASYMLMRYRLNITLKDAQEALA